MARSQNLGVVRIVLTKPMFNRGVMFASASRCPREETISLCLCVCKGVVMNWVNCGRALRRRPMSGLRLAVVSLALIVSACAHEPASYSQTSWYAGGPRPAAAPPVSVPVEMEDDGRPSQLPPPRAQAGQVADDPREPWSPNYGGQAKPMTSNQPQRQAALASPTQ